MLKKDTDNTTKVNLHAEHRKRLKTRFENEGLDSFQDHNIIEMLLFYSIPRCDTNELAHRLLNEFGSLSALMEADIDSLMQVPGMGHESAVFINFIRQLNRRYEIDRLRDYPYISNCEEAMQCLKPYFYGEKEEIFIALLLDGCCCVRKVSVLSRGDEESVAVHVNRIVKDAINNHATSVICAHSHPNGFAHPSRADITITEEIGRKLAAMNIGFCDHLIFSRDDVFFFSKENKLIDTRMFTFSET